MSSPESSTSSSVPLAKYLASTDKRTRDKAVSSLAAFLQSYENELPKSEMAKLWKGIFYCYWMSDKPLVQQALSSELAELILLIHSNQLSLAFLRGFWEAIVREWNGIDRLRMDKYYMLVRKFVNAGFRLLLRAQWDSEILRAYTEMLAGRGGPLSPEDSRVPSSLTYHLADIYLVELDKVYAQELPDDVAEDRLPAPLSALLHPFFDLAARTSSKVTYERVYTEVVDSLFKALKPVPRTPQTKRPKLLDSSALENLLSNACFEDSKRKGRMEKSELHSLLLRKLFDVASGPDVKEANRRKIYAVWKAAKAEEDLDD